MCVCVTNIAPAVVAHAPVAYHSPIVKTVVPAAYHSPIIAKAVIPAATSYANTYKVHSSGAHFRRCFILSFQFTANNKLHLSSENQYYRSHHR